MPQAFSVLSHFERSPAIWRGEREISSSRVMRSLVASLLEMTEEDLQRLNYYAFLAPICKLLVNHVYL